MLTITIDEEVQARFQAVAAPEADFTAFLAAAAQAALDRMEQQAKGRAEIQAMLDGPRRSHAESMATMRRKYNLPDFSPLSHEEREAKGDAILEALPPQKIAEAERQGLI